MVSISSSYAIQNHADQMVDHDDPLILVRLATMWTCFVFFESPSVFLLELLCSIIRSGVDSGQNGLLLTVFCLSYAICIKTETSLKVSSKQAECQRVKSLCVTRRTEPFL